MSAFGSGGTRRQSDCLLADAPQLFILKAFTKNYGMAGLRLGYGMSADAQLLYRMSQTVQPWNVSVLAQAAGTAALQEQAFLQRAREVICCERPYLTRCLQNMGLKVCPSAANYLLFRGPEGLHVSLKTQGIAIRSCDNYPGLGPGWYRLAVRLPCRKPASAPGYGTNAGKGVIVAKNIMIQGTMSNAGKSLLCAGLCRIFKQDGYRVAPFKSQNMALNSFITQNGGEMGRAQVVQAEAAGIEPDVCMNPILLKPTTDVGSQVIVNGKVQGNMRAAEYFRKKQEYLPAILQAYQRLDEQYDIIVIEGAGSPAEINLKQGDIVNMGLARLVDAPVLLVGDIDRGGVFAQLYGTMALLEPEERQRVKGTIVNKFRGDRAILQPGLDSLQTLCGVPVAGVIPYTHVDIDDEDSLSERLDRQNRPETGGCCGDPSAAHLQFYGFFSV